MNTSLNTPWEIRAAMDAKPTIVYRFRVEAPDEAAARRAAAEKLPAGFTVTDLRPARGDDPAVDLTGLPRI